MILFASTEVLTKLVQGGTNRTETRQVEDYTRLTERIEQNETAMEDSLAYVQAIMTIDKAKATEHLGEIKELTVSINQDKRQRDASLAAMIAGEWGGNREEFDRLLARPLSPEAPTATHIKLASIPSKLGKKNEELLRLQSKVKNQLSRLTATDTERDAQLLTLSEVSSKLSAELSAKSQI
ncbi:50S ribosomal protein L17 [Phytophthora cinnamomi]|uniref:50S ribosomal protein L17 n=1 Tax=Phytophthora cinnamomi TaxID=4785 RepID=UPI003559AE13|nr:50S ribosomal protein L17 [Phytophthora cinnamomi]